MSDTARKKNYPQDRHLSARQLARVARDAEHAPSEAHLGNKKLKRLERINGDSPTLRAILLIGGFFLILEALHLFSIYIRAQLAFDYYLAEYWYPIVDFFTGW